MNDTHSALNETTVDRVVAPATVDEVVQCVQRARIEGAPLAIAGGKHAMGGQQFLTGGTLLDMRRMRRVWALDPDRGLLTVEAGATWPDVMRGYLTRADGRRWGIRQKQTGADRLTVGGAVAANIHGRCLTAPPFVSDIESLEVVSADGEVVSCSRTRCAGLFRHVVGGYGLFGVVTAATLRLVRRYQVERVVQLLDMEELMETLDSWIANGFQYGDFQFATAPDDPRFLRKGVLSCYRPTERERCVPSGQLRLSQRDWNRLLELSHTDKSRAFDEFAAFYLATSGQLYWSDTHQLNLYLEDYHSALDHRLGSGIRGSEMITELYVPRSRLVAFMDDVRRDFLREKTHFIYGTIRLVERDVESALPWARQNYACVIFNLHIDHESSAIAAARTAFVRLIDHAIAQDGSYYLTYHRFARGDQLRTCHPRIFDFLCAKRHLDPASVFQSDWYRHLLALTSTRPQLVAARPR